MDRIMKHFKGFIKSSAVKIEEKIEDYLKALLIGVPCLFFLLHITVSIAIFVLFSKFHSIEKSLALAFTIFFINYVSSLFIFNFLVYAMQLKRFLINHPNFFTRFFQLNTVQKLKDESFQQIWMTRDKRLIIMGDFDQEDHMEDFLDKNIN